MRALTEDDKKFLRLEYELLKKSILERNRRLYFAISIILSASVLAILACFQYRENFMIKTVIFSVPIGIVILSAVLLILIVLLLLHYTAVEVSNDADYDTMKKIVETLGVNSPMLRMYEERLKRKIFV